MCVKRSTAREEKGDVGERERKDKWKEKERGREGQGEERN